MEILIITKADMENDWRFWDLKADVYEVEKPEDFDCSLCAIRGQIPVRKTKVIIPFQVLREMAKQNRFKVE